MKMNKIEEKIIKRLEEIEREKNIKILFACESGSRAWGFASPDSDYDIRFIYSHPIESYLSISEQRDSIELPIQDDLDFGGWELRKALRLFYKSNAVIFEWLQSPIHYIKESPLQEKLWDIRGEFYSLRAALNHYIGLSKKSFKGIIEKERPKLKKYFYVIRPLLSAVWIVEKRSIPPMELAKLMPVISHNPSIQQLINELLNTKERSFEADEIQPVAQLHPFITNTLLLLEESVKKISSQQTNRDKLNQIFRHFIGG